jgi:hypothetical protein
MTYTIQIGVWEISSSTIRISGTESVHSNNYQHERKRHNKGKAKSTNGYGRG